MGITKEKFCLSYSLGKDSTLALNRMIEKGHRPVALIISVNEDYNLTWFHGVENNFLDKVSKSLGIKIIKAVGNGKNYREVLKDGLKEAKGLGATSCVFGDIDIEEHKEWGNKICEEVGLKSVYPLWQENRETIVKEFINKGFKGIVKTVSKEYKVSKEFLGRDLNLELLEEFRKIGIDLCGENGEYHTFVYDGKLFKEPIKFKKMSIHESEYSYSLMLGELDG